MLELSFFSGYVGKELAMLLQNVII